MVFERFHFLRINMLLNSRCGVNVTSASPKTRRALGGFSLVEVAMALGVVAFALLSILALLPVGMKANQVSADESRAVGILSALEADLRNTHPNANGGKSHLFGLTLPYKIDPNDAAAKRIILNSSLTPNALTTVTSIGIKDDGSVTTYTTATPVPYQATVIYTKVASVGSAAPTCARLIVNWPCQSKAAAAAALTTKPGVKGFVEAYVTFPTP